MNTQIETANATFTKQIISQVKTTWTGRNTAVTAFMNKYPNEDVYLKEIAPGRNRAIYLFGHLIAVNDGMIPLMGLGEKLFPELEAFVSSPDKSFEIKHSVKELKQAWEKLNVFLTERFNNLNEQEWLGKHTAVSEEDFVKDPQRNKLNILIGRTNHQSYHLGQMNLLPV